jgi:L-asparaginase II
MPLVSLAKGMATLCSKSAQGRSAERQIIEAMLTYPYLIAGKKRYCTRIMEKFPGKLIIKMGADGVFSAIIPDKKWGISLKIDDGNLKAAEVAMSRILQKYVFPEKDLILEGEVNPKLKNWNKTIVGNYFTDF